jgi:Fur family transcriptional regulator, ferric uptake regulator
MNSIERRMITGLKQQGYKLTPQRRAVIKVIAATADHLTATALYEKIRQDHSGIGQVTVYRTLELLGRLGLICEVHAGGSCHSFTAGSPEKHLHLICSDCGEVTDVGDYDFTEMEQALQRETGYEIEGHLLEFTGLCQHCRKATNPQR